MKQFFLTLVAIVLSVSVLSAQDNGKKYHFGASAGVNFSNITGSDAEDMSTKTGFQVGLLYEPFLSEKFSIETGLYYSQQGAEYEGLLKGKFMYDYIHIPIMPKYYLAEKFSMALGSYLALNVRNKIKYDQSVNGTDTATDEDLKGFDLGLKVKAQFNITEQFFLAAEYSNGLLKTHDKVVGYNTDGTSYTIDSPKTFNNNIGLVLGYNF